MFEPKRGLMALAVFVAVVVGCGAGIRVFPWWWRQCERKIAAEAFEYLEDIWAAQQLHYAQHGRFATRLAELDVRMPPPVHFSVTGMRPPGDVHAIDPRGPDAGIRNNERWALTLRRAATPVLPNGYTLTFSDRGYEPSHSTIDQQIAPATLDVRLAVSGAGDPK